ncbi:MAG: hypothetical protein ACKOW9_01540 [Candidatus Paceibacterota bacterium]
MSKIELYDGAKFCDCGCGQCPVVEFDQANNEIKIYDPAKPERGTFRMSKDEYNTLLSNAKRA